MDPFKYSSYKALLFDLDDTLLDFKSAEANSLNLTFENFYKADSSEKQFTEIFHRINKELWRTLEEGKISVNSISLKRFELLTSELLSNVDPNVVAHFYDSKLSQTTTWLPEVEDSIHILKNKYKLGIVTNGFTHIQRAKYELFNIAGWCQAYVISEEVGFSKPDKTIFDIALKNIEESPETTLMVGDSITSDFKGAINARIDFCWVNPDGHTLPENFPKPIYMIKSVEELPNILSEAQQ